MYHVYYLHHRNISPNNFLRYHWYSRDTCTTKISHQVTLWDIIDWISLIINDHHWLSFIIIDFHLLSLIIIYYHYITSQKKAKAALQLERDSLHSLRGGGSGDIKIQAGPVVYRTTWNRLLANLAISRDTRFAALILCKIIQAQETAWYRQKSLVDILDGEQACTLLPNVSVFRCFHVCHPPNMCRHCTASTKLAVVQHLHISWFTISTTNNICSIFGIFRRVKQKYT